MTKNEAAANAALKLALEYMNERLEDHDSTFMRHPATEADRDIILANIKEVKEALAQPAQEFPVNWASMIHYPDCWDTAAYPELRDAIHEVLAWGGCSVCKAQPAQEPVHNVTSNGRYSPLLTHMMNKRTAPQQEQQSCDKRPWVRLTIREIEWCFFDANDDHIVAARNVEFKLKEKNT